MKKRLCNVLFVSFIVSNLISISCMFAMGNPAKVSQDQIMLNGNLIAAVKDGNINRVKEWIKKGANVNALDKFGKTPLQIATGQVKNAHALFLEILDAVQPNRGNKELEALVAQVQQKIEALAGEEPIYFDVRLVKYPQDKKIWVIKVIRDVTGLGLKEAKDLVERVPKVIVEDKTKEDAEEIKKKLEGAGAMVEIQGEPVKPAQAAKRKPIRAAERGVEAEPTYFDVMLNSYGDKKVAVIKIIREVTGLGLKEAKDLVESVPKVVVEGKTKEEAEEIKKKFEEAGAIVEIQGIK